MQVILLERVAKLGQMGEVVKVKEGYARCAHPTPTSLPSRIARSNWKHAIPKPGPRPKRSPSRWTARPSWSSARLRMPARFTGR